MIYGFIFCRGRFDYYNFVGNIEGCNGVRKYSKVVFYVWAGILLDVERIRYINFFIKRLLFLFVSRLFYVVIIYRYVGEGRYLVDADDRFFDLGRYIFGGWRFSIYI